jgi:DNA-binding transcriptional LysR family regulator
MKRFDLFTLKLFITIADTGGLTAAAKREHLALAAVSKRISDLEELAGTTLLYRLPRGVELTPAGKSVLYHARRVFENLARLEADLSEFSQGVKGHIRIYSNTSAVIAFLPLGLSTFCQQYPDVKIDLHERTSSEIVGAIREGLADIGIFAAHVDAKDLQMLHYQSDRLMLVVPEDHPLGMRSSVRFEEVTNLDFIGLQHDTSLHTLLHDMAQQAGDTLRMRVQVRSFDAICRMVHHGMGVGVLPQHAVSSDLRDLRLTCVPLEDAWARVDLVIGMRDYDSLSSTAKHLVNHLLAMAAPSAAIGP